MKMSHVFTGSSQLPSALVSRKRRYANRRFDDPYKVVS